MKTTGRLFVGIITGFLISSAIFAQTFQVEIQIKNQPSERIIFGSVKGDNFFPIDSNIIVQPAGKINFSFPNKANAGIYRIVLGKTAYAKVMNQNPQQFDFIFDSENLVFQTDFNEPLEKLVVVQSKENKVWYNFLKADKILTDKILLLKGQIDGFWKQADTAKIMNVANEYNTLQMERDVFILKTINENKGLFATQMIKNQRQPMLDAYLSPSERNTSFKNDFFKIVDFTDPALINSSVYTDNIFNYLVHYNNPNLTQKQRETEYIKAIDNIIPNVKQDEQVYQFILEYLVHGFTVLKMDDVLKYISKKYNYPN